jgi:Cu(I)/Ag(I) efflux system membrane fusion protein
VYSVYIPSLRQEFDLQKTQILLSANQNTRTLNLRAKIDNPNEVLKPGLSAFVNIKTKSPQMLLIPSSAVIDTGSEQRVIAVDKEGAFVPKLIKVLGESDGLAAVEGLGENESVVTTGVFLIDSEADISGALERMRR